MGQLIARPTGRIVKTDINQDYRTYGNAGDVDYVTDGNDGYQPSNYDEMNESNYDEVNESSYDEMNETSLRRSTHSKVKTPGILMFIHPVTASRQKAEDDLLLHNCIPVDSGPSRVWNNPFPQQQRCLN